MQSRDWLWVLTRIGLPSALLAMVFVNMSIDRQLYEAGVQASQECIGFMADPDGFDPDRQAEMVKDRDYREIKEWVGECAEMKKFPGYRAIYK